MSVPAQLVILESTATYVSHRMCSHNSELFWPALINTCISILTYVYKAVCDPPCENGGRCVAPGVCSCAPEWEGSRCEQGKLINCLLSNFFSIEMIYLQLCVILHVKMMVNVFDPISVPALKNGRETYVMNVNASVCPLIT